MKQLADIELQLAHLQRASLKRRRRVTDSASEPRVTVDGHPMLAFCSNDYLGLAAHPQVAAALREGSRLYGSGSGASHLISGHSRAHALLEERLADWMQAYIPAAQSLYFCTGYMANLAILTALAALQSSANTTGTTIFSESLNHASLIDGARLAKAQVQVYPHGDVEALQAMLESSDAAGKIVVTDSVFSMDGDLAALPVLLALCEQHDAWLVVDDAHGFGVLGEQGRGALEHFNLHSANLVYMGTLGKAAGVAGAFVAAHASVIDWLIQKARPYIYSTAAPPALAHALLTSLDIIGGEEGVQRRHHLQNLIEQLRQELHVPNWSLMPSTTAIQPVLIGDNAAAMAASACLYQQGIWVPAIRPPTVPLGTARLRITLSAAHCSDDLTSLIEALHQIPGAP